MRCKVCGWKSRRKHLEDRYNDLIRHIQEEHPESLRRVISVMELIEK